MKRLILLIFLLPLIFSCQSNDFEAYQMSWMGWGFMAAGGIGILLVFVFRKGIIEDTEENSLKIQDLEAAGFKPLGNYVGGHPAIQRPVPGIVFRKNSHCCMFFYSNHTDNPPEFKFKIKIGSFRNIVVEDNSSFNKGISSERSTLPGKALNIFRKKRKDQLALLKIDWTDGESIHSLKFSFEGNDAVQKAHDAKESLVQALD